MEEKFNSMVWNRLYYDGKDIVAEIQPTLEGHRRWFSIDKFKPQHPDAPNIGNVPKHKYFLFDFELDKKLIDEYFGDDDMKNQVKYYVNTEEELFLLLKKIKISPSLFTYPWKCNYPF